MAVVCVGMAAPRGWSPKSAPSEAASEHGLGESEHGLGAQEGRAGARRVWRGAGVYWDDKADHITSRREGERMDEATEKG